MTDLHRLDSSMIVLLSHSNIPIKFRIKDKSLKLNNAFYVTNPIVWI